MRFLETFFFGYLGLKWRRLARFISFTIVVVSYGILINIGQIAELGFVLLGSPIIVFISSWLLEPFVIDKPQRMSLNFRGLFSGKKAQAIESQTMEMKISWDIIGKALILFVGSFISYALALENGTFSYPDFGEYFGFTLGPMIISFPIYMFKRRKKFWYLFYRVSIWFWGIFISLGLINIILDSLSQFPIR